MIPEKEQTAVFLESGCIKFHKKFREGNGFQGLGKSKSQTQGHDNKAYSAAGNPWDEMGNRLPRKVFPTQILASHCECLCFTYPRSLSGQPAMHFTPEQPDSF